MNKYFYLTENELINIDKVLKIERQKFNNEYFLVFYFNCSRDIAKIKIPEELHLNKVLSFINQETKRLAPSISLKDFIKKQLK